MGLAHAAPNTYKDSNITSMHSSRMRTARLLPVSLACTVPVGGGMSAPGGSAQTPPPLDRILDTRF